MSELPNLYTMLYSRLVNGMLFSLYIVFIMLISSSRIEAKVKLPPNVVVKAVYAFGDSIVDQGNNNNIVTTPVKCNFPPYGKDFMGGMPTGRFSNAKTPPDMIAKELGLKELIPAYLDPNLKVEDLKTGVSFASGGSGYDPRTSTINSAIPLSAQLNHFKEYIGKLKELVGEEEGNYILNNSLFILVAGSVDIAGLTGSYYEDVIRQKLYDIDSYTSLLASYAFDFVQELYKLGARNIAFLGVPPLGCVPAQRTLAGGPTRMCAEEYNQASELANTKFSIAIDSLHKKFPQYKLVFIDVYNSILDCIVNPQKYGLEEVQKGCCGSGNIEVSILCNKFSGTCEDDTKYLFWDSYHLTEKGYRILVDQIIKSYTNSFS
ncbi:PREDICTED: GDSL esterase/lipase EXL3-like [Nicotiana attenuata]|uniref:Gdsl esteraselipase exl3 n=1 Tax=Nicotiana attenuata TaxID=49451 RepID=A0A1J6IFP1_NICAT|nr:PREDICTED: GDSL esterase/lipase EXL3-like [Nicotiana attenuata]OIT03686.1 gdsl esteraselipase exl3 [Nicotiana attenuata]